MTISNKTKIKFYTFGLVVFTSVISAILVLNKQSSILVASSENNTNTIVKAAKSNSSNVSANSNTTSTRPRALSSTRYS